MVGEITLVEVRPRPIAVVRVTTLLSKWPGEFGRTLDKVYAAVRAGRIQQGGHNVMVYRPRQDGLVDIECGIEVAGTFDGFGEIVCCETPEGRVATAAHIGPYQELGASHAAIREWSGMHGHRLSGTCWEIYGDWDADVTKLRTDLFHLLAR